MSKKANGKIITAQEFLFPPTRLLAQPSTGPKTSFGMRKFAYERGKYTFSQNPHAHAEHAVH